jgi:hypothetical protein
MGWSMDRQGIRTLFDAESRRLKQVELSGSRRERVSLRTYPNELSAREAEVRKGSLKSRAKLKAANVKGRQCNNACCVARSATRMLSGT